MCGFLINSDHKNHHKIQTIFWHPNVTRPPAKSNASVNPILTSAVWGNIISYQVYLHPSKGMDYISLTWISLYCISISNIYVICWITVTWNICGWTFQWRTGGTRLFQFALLGLFGFSSVRPFCGDPDSLARPIGGARLNVLPGLSAKPKSFQCSGLGLLVERQVCKFSYLGLLVGRATCFSSCLVGQNVWRWAQFLRWGHSCIKPKYLGWATKWWPSQGLNRILPAIFGGKPRSFSICLARLGGEPIMPFQNFVLLGGCGLVGSGFFNCQWPSLWSYILYVYFYTCGRPPRSYLSHFWMVFFPYKIQGLQKQNMICCLMFILKY